MGEHHPVWMIIVQYGLLISSGIDNWVADQIYVKNLFAADDILI
jgi:hypothetical protein